MTDNSTLPATGDIIAADDIGGVKYQRMKIVQGNDGVNDGDVSSTNPLATRDATLADIVTSIEGMNDSMLYMLSAMLEKMPRLDRTDKMMVDTSESSMSSAITYFTSAVNNPLNQSNVFRMFEPWNFSDAGSVRIYNQIVVG